MSPTGPSDAGRPSDGLDAARERAREPARAAGAGASALDVLRALDVQRLARLAFRDPRQTGGARGRDVLERLLALRARPDASAGARSPASDVERELLHVHRLEVAALLREAAYLRLAEEPVGGLCTRVPGPLAEPVAGSDAGPTADDSPWSVRALEVLVGCALDALELPDLGVLARCLASDAAGWPSAVELAEASLVAHDDERGRIALGRALVYAGDAERAYAVLVGALRRGVSDRRRWEVFDALAGAHEFRGSDRLALGALEAAARRSECGARPLVASLYLALATADARRSAAAARRLDRRLAFDARELAREIVALRTGVAVFRDGLPWSPPPRTRRLFEALRARARTASGEVCRALA